MYNLNKYFKLGIFFMNENVYIIVAHGATNNCYQK